MVPRPPEDRNCLGEVYFVKLGGPHLVLTHLGSYYCLSFGKFIHSLNNILRMKLVILRILKEDTVPSTH